MEVFDLLATSERPLNLDEISKKSNADQVFAGEYLSEGHLQVLILY